MNELLARIAADADVSQDTAKKAVGYILSYMKAEGSDPAVDKMIGETPGAEDAMAATSGAESGGGIMGLGSKLMGLGLDMGQIQTVARELVAFAKAHSDEATVNRVIASVPGLSQFA